jgi:hypothetical protein
VDRERPRAHLRRDRRLSSRARGRRSGSCRG